MSIRLRAKSCNLIDILIDIFNVTLIRKNVQVNCKTKILGIKNCLEFLCPSLGPGSDHSRYFRQNKFLRFLMADIPDPGLVTTSKPWHGAVRRHEACGALRGVFTGSAQTNRTSRGHRWLHCCESTEGDPGSSGGHHDSGQPSHQCTLEKYWAKKSATFVKCILGQVCEGG